MQYFQKLIQKDLGFTHTLGETVVSHDRANVWTLHRGTSKETGDASLVFHFDPSKSRNPDRNQVLSKAGLMRLKTLLHPDILKYITSVEGSDGTIYVATEPATPLATLLETSPTSLDRETVQWGLFTISRALGFMHSSGLIHARVNPSTIFVTPTGDWKLAGLECVTPHSSASSLAQHATSLQTAAYQSPEFSHANWAAVAAAAPSAIDSWALGCLMYEVHAGSLTSPDNLQNIAALPKPLISAYQKLLSSNPTARAPAGQIATHPYFQNSKFIELNMFVENLALKGQLEREAFLSKLANIMDRLPDSFCTHKILPMLSQSIETGTGGMAAFSCIVKMKDRISDAAFAANIVKKYALAWFGNASMDRNLRVQLYTKLDMFTPHMDENAINNVVFPAMCTSFQDKQAPALRDAAVKAVLTLSDRLSDKNLNSVLMSHFARLQVDPEPAIRTNTTVCLGKVAARLSENARGKFLAPAFIRTLKDPFPPARAAGLNAILTTKGTYGVTEMATRMLPSIVPLLVDGSGDVRKLAFKVVEEFEVVLKRNHEQMSRSEEAAAVSADGKGSAGVGAQNGEREAVGGSGGGSGWGLSSFTSMTASLLSRTESASGASTNQGQSRSATGISSEDFKAGRTGVAAAVPTAAKVENSSSVTGMGGGGDGSSGWDSGGNDGGGDGFGGGMQLGKSASNSTFGEFQTAADGGVDGGDGEDDDDDGWGDMDVKAGKEVDDEDLMASMLGKPATKTHSLPAGMMGSGGTSIGTGGGGGGGGGGGDLWDLGPAPVSRPKPRLPTGPSRGTGRGRGLGGMGATRTGSMGVGGSRRKTGGDDWEMLLGGTASTTRRKATGGGRGGAR